MLTVLGEKLVNMKKSRVLSFAALCAAAFAANSANAQSFNWAGFYVGAQTGGEWATASGPFTNADGSSPLPYSNSSSGGLFGVRAGYNWQANSFVFGIEGDVNAAIGMQNASNLPAPPTSYIVRSRQTWNANIRGRLGYAVDKMVVFAAAGLALGDVQTSYGGPGYAPPTGRPFSVTTQRVGWTAGVGAEYAITPNVIGSLEYRYTDLGQQSFSNANPLIDTADKVAFHSSAVLLGVAFKF